jgi:import inner membrane translocase subunit TIM9
MQQMQQMQQLRRVWLDIITTCFDNCVHNFKTRKLDNSEELCLNRCVEKYWRHMGYAGQNFYEYYLTLRQKK